MEIKPIYMFVGIVLLVPAQLLLSNRHLNHSLHSLISAAKAHIPAWISPIDAETEAADAQHLVVETDGDGNGAYGLGQYTRRRAPEVKFRVGDVVSHSLHEFRGVVIGWDEHAIAPKKFLKMQHGESKEQLERPHYAVLVDTRDYLTPQMTYIVQNNLKSDKGVIVHPLVDKFFEGIDEKRQKYIMRPIHKVWYPDD